MKFKYALILLCLPLATLADEVIPIAVVDFTASQRTSYQSQIPEYVVDELVNVGNFDVLERDKLDSVVGELVFQNSSGFVSPESAVQMGNMSGARLLVTGHILSHNRETQTYSGYGISTRKTIYTLKVRLEVIDASTGSKLFSNIASDSREITAVAGAKTGENKDLAKGVANKLVSAMLESPRIKNLVDGPELVQVHIDSIPEQADVEIDGTYYGVAGTEYGLLPGVHQVQVSLPGYETWSKRVNVQEGSKIIARLAKIQAEPQADN